MKLILPVTAAVALTPAMTNGFGLGRSLVRRPMIVTSPAIWSPGALFREQLREQQALMNKAFQHSSPRYEITDNDETFQVAVDVPGVKASDINVSIEDEGQVLTVSGHRESTKEGYSYSSKFSQSFSLHPAVDAEKFTANLQNGVLIVSAPKDWKKIEDAVKTIPITEHETTIPIAAAEKPVVETADAAELEVEAKEADETIDLDKDKEKVEATA